MRTLLACCLSSMFVSPAWAWESEQRELAFQDTTPLFSGSLFDTGYIPSDTMVSVRFHITPLGGVRTKMEATSDLTWPQVLTHRIKGVANTGLFSMDTTVKMSAEIYVDAWGVSAGFSVWSEEIEFEKEKTFTPLLLPGGSPATVTLTDSDVVVDTVEYDLNVGLGVSVQFTLDVYPELTAGITGKRVETGTAVMDRFDEATQVALPSGSAGEVTLTSRYVAGVTGDLDIVFQPGAGICAPWGSCYDVFDFEYPVDVANANVERRFGQVSYKHPLPSFDKPFNAHNFDEVEVGNLANLEVPIVSLGVLDLEGTATIEGSDAFSVFPEYFQATEDYQDGIVVTFAPEAAGDDSAVLVLATNDPAQPEVEIELVGYGYEEEVLEEEDETLDSDDTDSGAVSESVKTCGCSVAEPAQAVWPWLAGAAMLVRRRRRVSR
jgi:MYXO-CTERM domain-containing protein